MEHDLEGSRVGSDDDEFGDAAVEGLGGLIGALLDLLERGALRDQVEDLRGELFSSEGLGTFRDVLRKKLLTIVERQI